MRVNELPPDLYKSYMNYMDWTGPRIGAQRAAELWWQYYELNFSPEAIQKYFKGNWFYIKDFVKKDRQ